jgi:hypothetical protein
MQPFVASWEVTLVSGASVIESSPRRALLGLLGERSRLRRGLSRLLQLMPEQARDRKETEMQMIGSNLHARQQTLAILDTGSGMLEKHVLEHTGDKVHEFYCASCSARCHRSNGFDAVVPSTEEELGARDGLRLGVGGLGSPCFSRFCLTGRTRAAYRIRSV